MRNSRIDQVEGSERAKGRAKGMEGGMTVE